jgi:hypothetical protein
MKINNFLKLSAAAAICIASFGVANAQNGKNVKVNNFSSITVSSGIDLYLTQGSSESLSIKGNDDLIKDVIVEQDGAALKIRYKEGINWGRLFKNQSIKVYVTFKSLKGLTASGGSDVYTQNNIKADMLSVTASGGSDLKLNLSCKDLQLSVSGGSDAALRGTGENMSVSASGGSDIDAFAFVVNYAKVNASGGSDANINATKAIEASASGGSDITYKGNAVLKKTGSSKSGDVSHVN